MGIYCSHEEEDDTEYSNIYSYLRNERFYDYYSLDLTETAVITTMNGKFFKGHSTINSENVLVKIVQSENEILNKIDMHVAPSIVHPNILTPKEYFFYMDYYYIVYPMPEGQDLLSLIYQDTFRGDLSTVVEIITQMLIILKYFEVHRLIHRNLNPNLFYLNQHNNKLTLVDCSSACNIRKPDKKVVTNLLFTSPEMISSFDRIDSRTDIYSIGVIMYTMLYGIGPYNITSNHSVSEIRKMIEQGRIISESYRPERLEKSALDFLNQALHLDPKLRPSTSELLNHTFINNYKLERSKLVLYNYLIYYSYDLKPANLFPNLIGTYFKIYYEKDVDTIFSIIDDNKNGMVSWEELVDILSDSNHDMDFCEKLATDLFSMLDMDQRGYLDYLDFSTMVFRVGSGNRNFKKFSQLISNVKPDVKNYIEVEYFLRMLDIKEEYILKKLRNYAKSFTSFDLDSNSFDLEVFFTTLFKNCDRIYSYKFEGWYKKITYVKKRIHFDTNSIKTKIMSNVDNTFKDSISNDLINTHLEECKELEGNDSKSLSVDNMTLVLSGRKKPSLSKMTTLSAKYLEDSPDSGTDTEEIKNLISDSNITHC